jgi:hypothetical protein
MVLLCPSVNKTANHRPHIIQIDFGYSIHAAGATIDISVRGEGKDFTCPALQPRFVIYTEGALRKDLLHVDSQNPSSTHWSRSSPVWIPLVSRRRPWTNKSQKMRSTTWRASIHPSPHHLQHLRLPQQRPTISIGKYTPYISILCPLQA